MSTFFTVSGLSLDIIGVILLFMFSPEKFPDPQWSAFFAVEGEAKKARKEWIKKQPLRRKLSALALIIIATGFSLQLLGELPWFTD